MITISYFNLTQDFIKELKEIIKNYNVTYTESSITVKDPDRELLDYLEWHDINFSKII